MSDYFDFLKGYKNIYENASYTEELLESVDSIYKLSSFENQMRKTLETIVNKLISVKLGNVDSSLDLRRKIDLLYSNGIIDAISKDNYHTIRQGGNIGSHALNTMDTYSQQKFYAERRELAENSYKRLYVECHRFVYEYMENSAPFDRTEDSKNKVHIEDIANLKSKSAAIPSISSAKASSTENVDSGFFTPSFGKLDDEISEEAPTKVPTTSTKQIILKIFIYVWWVIYAIWRVNDIDKIYPHMSSSGSLRWLRKGGIESFFSDYFDMLLGMEAPEFHFINLGLILCIISAIITYKKNKNTKGYIGRNSKGVFLPFLVGIIIITLSFSFPYSVNIPEGTTVASTSYYDKGYSHEKYDDNEWRVVHAKTLSVKYRWGRYLVTTEEGAFEVSLPKNKYLDIVAPSYESDVVNYGYDSSCDRAIRCIDNNGNLYMVYIIMPDGKNNNMENSETYSIISPKKRIIRSYYDSMSGIRVVITIESDYSKEYLGTKVSGHVFIEGFLRSDSVRFVPLEDTK